MDNLPQVVITRPEEIGAVLNSNLPFRVKAEAIEAFLLPMPQTRTEAVHLWAAGLYRRELLMPANVVYVSRVHKVENIVSFLSGRITVFSENGAETLVAPCTFVTRAGTKRIAWTHEDTLCVTVHATKLTEADGVAAIEAETACNTFAEYEEYLNQRGNSI